MKAILIDSPNRDVREVELESDDYRVIAKLLNCRVIQMAGEDQHGNVLFVDEESLIQDAPPAMWFSCHPIYGPGNILAGSGLILGMDQDGEGCDHNLDVAKIREAVSFYTMDQIRQLKSTRQAPNN